MSTVFAVTIFNLFCSIYYTPCFESYRFGGGKITILFQGVAVAVFLFAMIFVMYSNNYFLKTRKKEIGIYSLLGMRKTKIAFQMFLETFVIGILATICGTVLGTVSSGYFTALLLRFMGEGTVVTFSISSQAILVTLAAFFILFVINGVRAYRIIYHYQLIELFSASKESESMPKGSVLGAVAAVISLIIGYVLSEVIDVSVSGFELLRPAFIIIFLVCGGTYLLFINIVPMLIHVCKKNHIFYYKSSNFISISQISFRIKGNARILSVSAILCAITITMISSSYSLYHGLQDLVDFYAPYSYIAKDITDQQHEQMLEAVTKVGEVTVTQDDKIDLINAHMEDEAYHPDPEKYQREDDSATYLISESQYLTIIHHTEAKYGDLNNLHTSFEGNLGEGDCYFIDANPVADYCKDMVGSQMMVFFGKETYAYQVTGISIHKYLGMVDGFKKSTLVLCDSEYEKYRQKAGVEDISTFYGIMFDDEMASTATSDQLDLIVGQRFFDEKMPGNISYISYYHKSFYLYGAYVFIGVFIGILFLLAVGSVLYYKLIIEAQEEKSRYDILRKTGMNQKEIASSIRKQLGLTYLLPLLVGLVHTIFALLTYNRTLEGIGQETPTLLNAAIVVVCYVVMYGVFYLLSTYHYQKIVLQHHLS